MSTRSTQDLLDRYFAAMHAGEDFSRFFDDDVSWTMVDSHQEVRGAAAVRDYIIKLHRRMRDVSARALVVAEDHAVLEGEAVDAEDGDGQRLSYCLVYDLRDDRVSAMRCYGNLARLMAGSG